MDIKKLIPVAYTKKILGRNVAKNAIHSSILFCHASGFNKEIMTPIINELSNTLDTQKKSVNGILFDFSKILHDFLYMFN